MAIRVQSSDPLKKIFPAPPKKPLSVGTFKELTQHAQSDPEAAFSLLWGTAYPELPFRAQYMFHEVRDFRFDFCWPDEGRDVEHRQATGGIYVEINGGLNMAQSGHNGKAGVESDYEKLAHASASGWIGFLLSPAMGRNPIFLNLVAETIRRRQARLRGTDD